jgi:hypothetical protein
MIKSKLLRLTQDEKILLSSVDSNWRSLTDYDSPRTSRKKGLKWKFIGNQVSSNYISARPKTDLSLWVYFTKQPLGNNTFEVKTFVYDVRSRDDKLRLTPEEGMDISFYHSLCISSTLSYETNCFCRNEIPCVGDPIRDLMDILEPNNYKLFKRNIIDQNNLQSLKQLKLKVLKKEIKIVKLKLRHPLDCSDKSNRFLFSLKREHINKQHLIFKLNQLKTKKQHRNLRGVPKRRKKKEKTNRKGFTHDINICEFETTIQKCKDFFKKMSEENNIKPAREKVKPFGRLAHNLLRGMKWLIERNFDVSFCELMQNPYDFFWVKKTECIMILRNVI